MYMRKGITLVAISTVCPFALASTSSSYELERVVVTGSRTMKTLKETPVKTEVISNERIQEQNYTNVSEAILDISGVTLQGLRGKEGQSAVMQGLAEEHILVLVDGIPVLQTSSNGVDLSDLSTLNIKQIEVVKGGASALYGGQAMGGVINIITQSPEDKTQSKFRLEREANFTGAQNEDPGYTNLMLSTQGRKKSLLYGLSLVSDKHRSIDRDEGTVSRDSNDTDKLIINSRIGYYFSKKHKLELRYNRFSEQNKTYGSKLLSNSSYTEANDKSDILGEKLRLTYKLKSSESFDSTFYLSQDRVQDELSLQDDPLTAYTESLKTSEFVENRFEYQGNLIAGENHILTGGFVTASTSLDQDNKTQTSENTATSSSEVNNKTSYTNEIYMQDDWFLGRSEIITGVRLTKDKYFEENISPKINYSYNHEHGDYTSTYRVALGTGYRIPSLKERFYVLDHRSFAGYVVYGNDNLAPETSRSIQFTYDLVRNKEFAFNISVYNNQVNNLIIASEQNDDSSDTTFKYQNVDRVDITGYEFGASMRLPNSMEVSGSFNHTKAVNEDTGNIIPNRPFYTGNLSLKHRFYKDKIQSIYLLRHFGESYATEDNSEGYVGYQQLDWKLNTRLGDVDTFVGIRNLFDIKRDALIDSADPIYDQRPVLGRTFYAGVQYEI